MNDRLLSLPQFAAAVLRRISPYGALRCAMVAAIALQIGIAGAQAIPELGFTTMVSAALISRYTPRFGPPTPERLSQWMTFAREEKSHFSSQRQDAAKRREIETLAVVNDAINKRINWVEDREHWGIDDYWATPAESVGSAGGDCEDYSIAKYYLLKELGVPLERLRITYVRVLNRNGLAHMVLAYYANPDAEPLILDNLDAQVQRASQRGDLEPVYSFNDDDVQIVQGARKGRPSQIRAWLSVQERLIAEGRT
jgi:predicted transglutaminase-like cysteine proteinase